jgi:hypothetical protein
MQTAIAKLCVDAEFRNTFQASPDEALQRFALTDDERAAVKGIDSLALERYAESLIGKRSSLVTKWFPITFSAMRRGLPTQRLHEILSEYSHQNIRDTSEVGGEWVRSEALRFRNFLQGVFARDQIGIPHIADLLEFEITRQLMSQDPSLSTSPAGIDEASFKALAAREAARMDGQPLLAKHVRLQQFHCDIVEVLARVENGHPVSPVSEQATWVMFIKKPGLAKVVVQTVTSALNEFLTLCDGTRTTTAILETISARYADDERRSDDVRNDCRAVLEQFYLAGLMAPHDTDVFALSAIS